MVKKNCFSAVFVVLIIALPLKVAWLRTLVSAVMSAPRFLAKFAVERGASRANATLALPV